MEELAVAYRHCERVTRQRAGNFFYGIRLLPPAKRREHNDGRRRRRKPAEEQADRQQRRDAGEQRAHDDGQGSTQLLGGYVQEVSAARAEVELVDGAQPPGRSPAHGERRHRRRERAPPQQPGQARASQVHQHDGRLQAGALRWVSAHAGAAPLRRARGEAAIAPWRHAVTRRPVHVRRGSDTRWGAGVCRDADQGDDGLALSARAAGPSSQVHLLVLVVGAERPKCIRGIQGPDGGTEPHQAVHGANAHLAQSPTVRHCPGLSPGCLLEARGRRVQQVGPRAVPRALQVSLCHHGLGVGIYVCVNTAVFLLGWRGRQGKELDWQRCQNVARPPSGHRHGTESTRQLSTISGSQDCTNS